ncbi:MAG: hypothetical protein LBK25_05960 [Treponema sp.]|nr:hypothetical protein [Treponema sp.]
MRYLNRLCLISLLVSGTTFYSSDLEQAPLACAWFHPDGVSGATFRTKPIKKYLNRLACRTKPRYEVFKQALPVDKRRRLGVKCRPC